MMSTHAKTTKLRPEVLPPVRGVRFLPVAVALALFAGIAATGLTCMLSLGMSHESRFTVSFALTPVQSSTVTKPGTTGSEPPSAATGQAAADEPEPGLVCANANADGSVTRVEDLARLRVCRSP